MRLLRRFFSDNSRFGTILNMDLYFWMCQHQCVIHPPSDRRHIGSACQIGCLWMNAPQLSARLVILCRMAFFTHGEQIADPIGPAERHHPESDVMRMQDGASASPFVIFGLRLSNRGFRYRSRSLLALQYLRQSLCRSVSLPSISYCA